MILATQAYDNQWDDKSALRQHEWDLVANAEWAPAQLTDHQQIVNRATSPFVNSSQGSWLREESFWKV